MSTSSETQCLHSDHYSEMTLTRVKSIKYNEFISF